MYAFCVLTVRLLALTLITYLTISPTARFQDISDAFSSNEVSLMGLAALTFVVLLCHLNPITRTTIPELMTREQITKSFVPGFMKGAVIAVGIILAFLLSGAYRFWGYFIQFGEAPLELANILLRTGALVALAYSEEFIFHYKLSNYLKNTIPDFLSACFIAVLYCVIKVLQFDLGMMHLVSLFLVSVSLYYRTLNEGEFAKGAGFWSAILVIFHPLLSLPIFGNHFSGILLIKFQTEIANSISIEKNHSMIRFLTGGAGGPLSSFAFQLFLILDIGQSILKRRKTVELQKG